jgi:LPXTG-motif cell wall-anchored protein
LVVLALVAMFAVAIPCSMMSAGASVSNPGAISVVFGCPAVSPPAGCVGSLSLNGTTPITIDGINGTGTGTIDGAGIMTFPLAGLSFAPFNILVAGAIPAVVNIQPLADWTGTLNPATGAMTLHGPLMSHLADPAGAIPAFLGTDCPVGPLDLNLTTGTSGAVTGTPYAAATGFGKVVDNAFVIPKTPEPNSTCNGATLINSGAPLPLAAGSSTTTLTMKFTPAPQPGVASTTTIAPTTTTTVAPTTTTTVAPTTTTTAAPTTTTTAAPTTTTTAAPTTTTTAAPTTTTTAAPTTTTTAAPTTTTTSAPTTTTTVAPTTTTVAPTTTTTAAPTTTTTAAPTTTTTQPPQTTTTVQAEGTTTTEVTEATTTTTVAVGGQGTTRPPTTAVSSGSGNLPRTGAPTMPLVLVGLGLVGAGAGLSHQRRRHLHRA